LDHHIHRNFFKATFHAAYSSPKEEAYRFSVFEASMVRAQERNQKNIDAGGEAIYGVTKFSDRTQEEFDRANKGRKGKGMKASAETKVAVPPAGVEATTAIDWTALGYTTPVKNQGQCGSCWAHSAVEQIESQWMLAGNAPWELSVQQVTSCTHATFGCGGGDTVGAYQQLMSDETKFGQKTWGVASAAMDPYRQSMYEECVGPLCTEECSVKGQGTNITDMYKYEALTGYYVGISDFSYATPACDSTCATQDLKILNANVAATGPASICVNAASWNDYVGGVMTTAACGGYAYDDLDHCVQLTGFDLTAASPYYIVRNSWATNWGNDGYIYLSSAGNTCGLADEATFVTIIDQ